MNRALLVSLLKKNIDELILLTEGFSEMSDYPAAIIHLARNKTDDIRSYIDQLGNISEDTTSTVSGIPDENSNPDIPLAKETDEVTFEPVAEIIISDETSEEEEEEEVTDGSSFIKTEEESDEEEDLITATKVVDEEILSVEKEEPANETQIEEVSMIDLTEEPKEIVADYNDSTPQETYETPIAEISVTDKKITIAEKLASQTITRNELHAKNESNGLNNTIAYKKIDDIRQAISLGDRFRFQRELFRNNGEEMNKMLNYINLLASYDEIVSFLQSKYGWPEDHPAANDFYQIIKRKF